MGIKIIGSILFLGVMSYGLYAGHLFSNKFVLFFSIIACGGSIIALCLSKL